MNILFVVPYVPNLIRVRPYNFIRHLSAQGHRVTVATLWGNQDERKELNLLAEEVERVVAVPLPRWRTLVNSVAAIPGQWPLQAHYCWQPQLVVMLKELFNRSASPPFDVVHVEHLRGVRYALMLQSFLADRYETGAPPIIWDSVDSISYLFRQASQQSLSFRGQLMTRLELTRTERFERWLMRHMSDILITSPHDRTAFLELSPSFNERVARLHVIPNGVDLEYFQPGDDLERQPTTLTITGKMSYHANISMVLTFVNDILPHIWADIPETRLEIVGKDPDRSILSLTRDPRILVTNTVPDLRPYLQRATVSVAPVAYGAGIQNKVLEAMACGTPVVATPKAVSAIAAVPEHDLLVADHPQDFAQAVVQLIRDLPYARRIGRSGLHFVQNEHDWKKISARLIEIYATCHTA